MNRMQLIMERTLVHDQNRRVEITVRMRKVGTITMTNQTMPPTQSSQQQKEKVMKK